LVTIGVVGIGDGNASRREFCSEHKYPAPSRQAIASAGKFVISGKSALGFAAAGHDIERAAKPFM
jgi:hypothetical protein